MSAIMALILVGVILVAFFSLSGSWLAYIKDANIVIQIIALLFIVAFCVLALPLIIVPLIIMGANGEHPS